MQVAAIVFGSFVLRVLGAVGHAAPRLFPDEYIYAALGRSLGEHGRPLVREGAAHFPALLQPILAAPLWGLADPATAYRLVQLENALFMSLAAIPAYLIASRLGLSKRYALFCGAFAVAIPDLVYSAYTLAEAVAYPLALASLYVGLVALDRPSARAQLSFLMLAGLTSVARPQYVVLFPAYAVAAAIVDRRRVVRTQRVLLGVAVAGILASLALGPGRLLGYYSAVLDLDLGSATLRWAVVDLFLLALTSGVALVPGALVGLALARGRREVAFAALATGFAAFVLFEAALYASNGSERFQERYLYSLLPLVPIAFGLYLRRGRSAVLAVGGVSAALVATALHSPLSGYAAGVGVTDSPLLGAVARLQQHVGTANGSLLAAALVLVGGIAAVAAARGRHAAALCVALGLVAVTSIGATAHDVASAGAVHARDVASDPSWVDAQSLGKVVAVETTGAPSYQLLQQLYWNRSIAQEVLLGGAEPTDSFAAQAVRVASDGTLSVDGKAVRSPILFHGYGVSATFDRARPVAAAKTFQLWQPLGTPRLRVLATGRYWDGWLGRSGSIEVWPATPGTLDFTLSLPTTSSPVRIVVGGSQHVLHPGTRLRLRFPIEDSRPPAIGFRALDASAAPDGRPVSVRSTMPRFTRAR